MECVVNIYCGRLFLTLRAFAFSKGMHIGIYELSLTLNRILHIFWNKRSKLILRDTVLSVVIVKQVLRFLLKNHLIQGAVHPLLVLLLTH